MNIKPIYTYNKTLEKLEKFAKKLKVKDKEDNFSEDPELIEIKDNIDEQEPVSTKAKELVEYIRDQKITRNIKYIVIHTTATIQDATVSAITNYWKNELGWKDPGYHIIYKPNNGYTVLSDFNNITNGVYGYNSNSIHLSYIGGIDDEGDALDNITTDQKALIDLTIKELLKILPNNVEIKGHRDFPGVKKACPSFDTKDKFNL